MLRRVGGRHGSPRTSRFRLRGLDQQDRPPGRPKAYPSFGLGRFFLDGEEDTLDIPGKSPPIPTEGDEGDLSKSGTGRVRAILRGESAVAARDRLSDEPGLAVLFSRGISRPFPH